MIVTIKHGRRIYNMHVPREATFGEVIRQFLRENTRMVRMGEDMDSHYFRYKGGEMRNQWVVGELLVGDYSLLSVRSRKRSACTVSVHCNVPVDKIFAVKGTTEYSTIADLRQNLCDLTGIPVCLLYLIKDRQVVLFDDLSFADYSIGEQSLIELKVIPGWDHFVRMLIVRSRAWLQNHLSRCPVACLFELKVALYIATCYNFLDLIMFCLEHRAIPSESVGSIPEREWCMNDSTVDTWVTPAHLAAKMGNLRVLKLFVRNNISCLLTRNKAGRSLYSEAHYFRQYHCSDFILQKIARKVAVSDSEALSWFYVRRILKWYCRAKVSLDRQRGLSRLISFECNPVKVFLRGGLKIDGLNFSTIPDFGSCPEGAHSSPAKHYHEIVTTYADLSYLGQIREAINVVRRR